MSEELPNKSNPALLNAEMEWNKSIQSASGSDNPVASKYSGFKKIGNPKRKPKVSIMITIVMTLTTYLLTNATVLLLTACDKNKRSLNFNFLEKIETKNAKMVMKPRPPIWIITSVTICPNKVNSLPIPKSYVQRPVTQVADVEIKIESR